MFIHKSWIVIKIFFLNSDRNGGHDSSFPNWSDATISFVNETLTQGHRIVGSPCGSSCSEKKTCTECAQGLHIFCVHVLICARWMFRDWIFTNSILVARKHLAQSFFANPPRSALKLSKSKKRSKSQPYLRDKIELTEFFLTITSRIINIFKCRCRKICKF